MKCGKLIKRLLFPLIRLIVSLPSSNRKGKIRRQFHRLSPSLVESFRLDLLAVHHACWQPSQKDLAEMKNLNLRGCSKMLRCKARES